MWIQVRSMDGRKTVQLQNLSKLTRVEEVREKLEEPFGAPPEHQRLFYRGKQLEDGHSLFDYDVGLNDLIQLLVRAPPPSEALEDEDIEGEKEGASAGAEQMDTEEATSSVVENGAEPLENGHSSSSSMEAEEGAVWKVGSKVDARDVNIGAWFEAVVTKVTRKEVTGDGDSSSTGAQVVYSVKYDDYGEEEAELVEGNLRPRARTILQWDQLQDGGIVMVNFNFDHPKERGFWYDGEVTRKEEARREKKLYCKIRLGESVEEEVRVVFTDEVYQIEHSLGVARENGSAPEEEGEAKRIQPKCTHCKDVPSRTCRFCGCYICGGKNDPGKQLLCDECDMAYHLGCLDPPLDAVPEEEEWYCPECKNDEGEVIRAGEKLRYNKKKAKMMSKINDCKRDWGKGMACVGRTKVCTIVPSNHFGPVPGITVGTLWKFRVQVSEAGIHRPHVAGIHGRESEGAYSIVLSGGYEDDTDNGEEFSYTGSGGRDLSGNKRTAKQSSDQTLTHMNKALAVNCHASFNDKEGAESKDWKKGKPVRVVRNFKGHKHSDYCPSEGNRYDGIYKVVRYWPEMGQAGFKVWRYLLRRHDPSPAPWTTEGKKVAKKLGLAMQYPAGYLEAIQQSATSSGEEESSSKGKGRKRKSSGGSKSSPAKAKKTAKFHLNKEQKTSIAADALNAKLWERLLRPEAGEDSQSGFLQSVEEAFMCICCQELACQPVTTPCAHNICKSCLQRSFKAEVFSCPSCRHTLQKDLAMQVNAELQRVLIDLFPGYEAGR